MEDPAIFEGFVYDTPLPEFKRIIDAARRVNAASYFVDSRGRENASPGEYELLMRVRDEFSGETRVLREPFRVVAR